MSALNFEFEKSWNAIPIEEKPSCNHGVTFDEEKAKFMDAYEIQKTYPRLSGKCPKGCGYDGIAYASSRHYYMGDW